jgi:hypothetical protein
VHREEKRVSGLPASSELVNSRAATVDQIRQHDHKANSGNDSNDGYVIHVASSFFVLVEVFLERLRHDDGCRAQGYEEKGGENEKDKRKDELDGGLGCLLLHFLASLDPQVV